MFDVQSLVVDQRTLQQMKAVSSSGTQQRTVPCSYGPESLCFSLRSQGLQESTILDRIQNKTTQT